MSHISFPSEQPHANGGQFYASFDSSAPFQMNPLSSHPPRTPRTSVTNNSHSYSTSVFDSREDAHEEEIELEEGTEELRQAEARVRKEEVWREMFLTSNGRDKGFKLIQYSLRVYLLLHASLTTSRLLRRPTRGPWERELVRRLESTADGLSFTRKCLLLFNWLAPLTAIRAQQAGPLTSSTGKSKKKPTPFLQALLVAPPPVLLELVQAIADDVSTCAKLGLLGKRTGERAGRFADWCWLLATLVGLVENGHEVESRMYTESMAGGTEKSKSASSKRDEKELGRLQKQDYWLLVTRGKLLMDLIFVCYDVFKIKRARESVKAFTGLGAAILSAAKLYDRHKSGLLKAVSLSI
ncbi:hypothetical protein FB45DRAFT_903452 [Roridomyces roridus]|uniref:Uncharacterized protein n=1 Tax=Roridomyces roridus TaxID=1738132 RepID=A0AAD7C4D6_9AGAR|nr:hypothetical protein FB45DRAFT_903452 [Roridomyces roridus]